MGKSFYNRKKNELYKRSMEMLKATSRTFYIPISRLAPGLKEAVASGYLCMRAIDEIEDHPDLPADLKAQLLRSVAEILRRPYESHEFAALFEPYQSLLPEVTVELDSWIRLCPPTATADILHYTAIMADGMADWVEKDWKVRTEDDLDEYTYYVAGLVGLMLSDLWKWDDELETDHELAVGFGRGLQAVNIIRNHLEDRLRGVSFFPDGWGLDEMFAYARRNLALAERYVASLVPGTTVHTFCKIPLVLAHGSLDAIMAGKEKLSRLDVMKLVGQVIAGKPSQG
jgi:farnesyl-diphosphate farnesyltransferase